MSLVDERPVRSESRKRTEVVAVRMTPEEKAEITAFAASRGMSVGQLLTACWTVVHAAETSQEARRG